MSHIDRFLRVVGVCSVHDLDILNGPELTKVFFHIIDINFLVKLVDEDLMSTEEPFNFASHT